MASSINSDQSRTVENIGSIALKELQKVFSNDTESAQSTELTGLTTSDDIHINNIVFSGDNRNVNNIVVDGSNPSPQSDRAIDTYVENFGLVEERLLSTDEQQNGSTTTDNLQTQTETERHIMISYNDLSFDVCQKICQRLQNLGYKVWMDEHDLHGRILEGMAQAIQNSDIVLLCYNEKYSNSDYCLQEAAYTFQKRIDFIPCRLQESYVPDGWLGILITDRLYIDFSSSNDFDNSFKKLIDEIEHIKAHPQTHRNRAAVLRSNDNDRNIQINNEIMREQFNNIIREYKESINKNDQDLNSLDKDELCELIIRLRERLFDDTLTRSNNEQRNLDSDRILCDVFKQVKNQTEFLKEIAENLSKLNDFKTTIKLSLAFLFVWTVKTHIIDAYLKQQ